MIFFSKKLPFFFLRLEAEFFLSPCYHPRHLQQILWFKILCRMHGMAVMLTITRSSHMSLINEIPTYSRVRNKHSPTFINFLNFFQGLRSYYGLKRLKFYYISLHILRGYVYSFCQIFQRLRLFKGLRLFRTLEYIVDCLITKPQRFSVKIAKVPLQFR